MNMNITLMIMLTVLLTACGGGGSSSGTENTTNDAGSGSSSSGSDSGTGDSTTGFENLSSHAQFAAEYYALSRYIHAGEMAVWESQKLLVPLMEAMGPPIINHDFPCPIAGTMRVINWTDSDGSNTLTASDNAEFEFNGCDLGGDIAILDNPTVNTNFIGNINQSSFTAIVLDTHPQTELSGGTTVTEPAISTTHYQIGDGAVVVGYINRPGSFLENDVDITQIDITTTDFSVTEVSYSFDMAYFDYDMGSIISVTTPVAIMLDNASGNEALMAGKFKVVDIGSNLAVTVTPGADPSYIDIAIDSNNDGTSESTERVLWSEFTDSTIVP